MKRTRFALVGALIAASATAIGGCSSPEPSASSPSGESLGRVQQPLTPPQSHGTVEHASAEFVANSDCSSSFASIDGVIDTREFGSGPPLETTFVTVQVSRVDACTGESLFAAGQLTPDVLAIAANLQSAHVVAHGTLLDLESQSEIPVSIDVTLSPLGGSLRQQCTTQRVEPGARVNGRDTFNRTDAVPTGSVLVDGTDFAAGAVGFGSIIEDRFGEVTIIP